MGQGTTTYQGSVARKTAGSWLSFKRLWRTDAVLNIVFGDLIALFASPIGEWMGMNDEGILLVRVVGVLTGMYGLWQLWSARSGAISKTVYLMGVADMMAFGAVLFGALVLGVEFNDRGTAITLLMGIGFMAVADVWYFASRKA